MKKYPFKSATIRYEQKGSENYTVATFDNYGEQEMIREVNFMYDKEVDSIIIIKDGMIYKYTPSIGAGSKRKFTDYNMIRINFANIGKIENNDKVNVEKLKNETVFGKDCEVYKVKAEGYTIEYSVWKNILLKEKNFFSELVAVEIIENPEVDKSIFEIPENVDLVSF